MVATVRGQSTIMHYQACSKDAFAIDRLVAAPVARRSCEYHEEALGVTGCLTEAKRTIPAVMELEEFVLKNSQ